MRTVPVPTASMVFTGIGAGAIALGVAVNKDPVSIGRMAAWALIVAGLILAWITTRS